ncbi:MAG: hypothetical protein ABSB19_18140 [Methylomonas sp.]|jgi:hypothetical protein
MSENNQPMQVIENPGVPIFYTDRIVSFSIGPAISKLNLGVEVNKNLAMTTATIVMPTSALIDSLSFLQSTLHENKALKDELIIGFDSIRKLFNEL